MNNAQLTAIRNIATMKASYSATEAYALADAKFSNPDRFKLGGIVYVWSDVKQAFIVK